MLDSDDDLTTFVDLTKIKRLQLRSAEQDLMRESALLSSIDDRIGAVREARTDLIERRNAFMSKLTRSDLTLNDVCVHHLHIMKADASIEENDLQSTRLLRRRSGHEARLREIRQEIIGLQRRLEQWEPIVSEHLNMALDEEP